MYEVPTCRCAEITSPPFKSTNSFQNYLTFYFIIKYSVLFYKIYKIKKYYQFFFNFNT